MGGSDLDSRSNHSNESEQSEALHAIEPEGKTAEDAQEAAKKRQNKQPSRHEQGSHQVASRKNKRLPGSKRPPRQRKGRVDDTAVRPRRRRLTVTDRFKKSVRWMGGRDPDEDIGLHSNEDSSIDSDHRSDDSGENGQVLLAIEPEGDTSEEERRKARKKRKKKKKRATRRENKTSSRSTSSREVSDEYPEGAFESHKSWDVESDDEVYI